MTTGDELADLLIVALVIAIEAGLFGRFALRRVRNAGGGSKKEAKAYRYCGAKWDFKAIIGTREVEPLIHA